MFKKIMFIIASFVIMAAYALAASWPAGTLDSTVFYGATSPPPYNPAYPFSAPFSGDCSIGATHKYFVLVPPAYPLGKRGIKFFTQTCK